MESENVVKRLKESYSDESRMAR